MMDQSVCVFVVDDDPLVMLTIEQALEDAGLARKTASSPDEADDLFREFGDTCRALITDVNLGGAITGWQVARSARER